MNSLEFPTNSFCRLFSLVCIAFDKRNSNADKLTNFTNLVLLQTVPTVTAQWIDVGKLRGWFCWTTSNLHMLWRSATLTKYFSGLHTLHLKRGNPTASQRVITHSTVLPLLETSRFFSVYFIRMSSTKFTLLGFKNPRCVLALSVRVTKGNKLLRLRRSPLKSITPLLSANILSGERYISIACISVLLWSF